MEQNLEEGDVVLCTVDRIAGTVVFANIEGTNKEASIITSEIAPGRIRNIRAYVVPKKKIVCKILRIDNSGNINLSLRRVSQKEKKEVLEQHKQEKKSESILKSILKDKTKKIISEIKKEQNLTDFLLEAKKNPSKLKKLVGKDTEKILEILNSEKTKKAVIKKAFGLNTKQPNGLELIKKILDTKEAEIKYLAAGKYSINVEADDLKSADHKIQEVLKEIEKQSKKNKIEFSIKGK